MIVVDERMTTRQAAEYLGISIHTLYNWRSAGKAPPARRINGGHPFYLRVDIDKWLRQRSVLEKPRKLR